MYQNHSKKRSWKGEIKKTCLHYGTYQKYILFLNHKTWILLFLYSIRERNNDFLCNY